MPPSASGEAGTGIGVKGSAAATGGRPDQPSRMRTLALPPWTSTRGLASGPTETVTSGLFAGGCGGSRSSAAIVPASVSNRTVTLPPEIRTAPGGTGPARVTTGGSPCSEKRPGTGSEPSP